MYILRMYVLDGCPSCQKAANFVQSKQVPCEFILANNDPIITAGKKSLNNGEDKYPVFVCNMTKDIIVGFKEEDYDRVCKAAGVLFGNSTWNVSGGGQPNNAQAPSPTTEVAAGTNTMSGM